MTCLIVSGIIGIYCAAAPPPLLAKCEDFKKAQICTIEAQLLRARISYYVPAWGGTNADSDPQHLGDMTRIEDCDRCMACAPGLYGSWIAFDGIGSYQCRDHGGAIHPTWGRWYFDGFTEEWVLIFDILAADGIAPEFAYHIVEWSIIE